MQHQQKRSDTRQQDSFKEILIHEHHENKKMIQLKKQLPIHFMLLPGMILFLLFSYLPMAGFIVAFKDYQLTSGFFGGQWQGLKFFSQLFTDDGFYLAIKNTIFISIIKFLATFPLPIIFALILNELTSDRFKKLIQTSANLPNFMSYIVIVMIWTEFLGSRGPINQLLIHMGFIHAPLDFLTNAKMFWGLGTVMDVWQFTGFSAIIYLAAISAVNPEIYEAAIVDGASRFRRMWHVTLPSIRFTIASIFILNIGNLFNGQSNYNQSFNQSYLMGNAFNHQTSYVIQHYIVEVGLVNFRYSFATAAGLLLSVAALILLLGANAATKKINGETLF